MTTGGTSEVVLDKKRLLRRLLIWGPFAVVAEGILLFVPARTFQFWQAWAILFVRFAGMAFLGIYFFKRDPMVLERRSYRKEPQLGQKILVTVWRIIGAVAVVIAGFDFRFGWSREYLCAVPAWVEVISFLPILISYGLLFEVLKANRFAASVIQIESGQRVMTAGPYRHLRHPMYFAFALMGLFTPIALGSFAAFLVSLFTIPIIVLRLVWEEKLLQRDLPGYADFCRQTRYRLVPFIW